MKKYLSVILIIFYWVCGSTQLPLNKEIKSIIDRQNIHPSVVGVSVYNITDNIPVASLQGNSFMIPASSMKVITTFICLDIKGKEFQFETKLGYSGEIESDGTLKGDIWLIGAGDPSFGSSREGFGPSFEKIISEIAKAIEGYGVSCIDGNIYVDNSRFDDEGSFPGWSWNDVGNYYGGGIYGLNINENEYRIIFDRNMMVSKPTTILAIEPPIPGLVVDNRVILAEEGTGDNAYIYGGPGFFNKIIKGTIPKGKGSFSIRGSIPYPPSFASYLLFKALEKHGISSYGYGVKGFNKKNKFNEVHNFKSKKLETLVKIANEKSINLYCEAFLKILSENGSREDGIATITQHLSNLGLDTMDIIQKDGSGLSSRNVITPHFFTSFLSAYYRKWNDSVLNLLPRTSYEGTVKGLLKSKSSKGEAWLKSGYIGGVLTYTGYLKSSSGKMLAISIMFNNYIDNTSEMREITEQIIDLAYQKTY